MGKRRTYSHELKVEAVEEYLKGESSYGQVARQYDVSSRNLLRDWVDLYRRFGPDGLKKRSSGHVYSGEFKLSVLDYKQTHSATNRAVAAHFGLPSGTLVSIWQQKYLAEGTDGLALKVKGQAGMTRKNDGSKNGRALNESEREELKRLRRENEFLRVENLYRKKLETLTRKKRK